MNFYKTSIFLIAIIGFCFFIVPRSYSQNSVGIGTASSNPNAVLELVSPNKDQGFLVPKLTTAERSSATFTSKLSATDNGLLVYDSDLEKFFFWVNSQWIELGNTSNLTPGTGIDITNGVISATGDADADPTNEIQDLSLTTNSLSITNNTNATLIDLSGYLDNTDSQNLSNVLGAGNDAGGSVITNIGSVGIGIISPLGAHHVKGSHYEEPTVIDIASTPSYIIGKDEYLVLVIPTGTGGTITLPPLASSVGRVITVRATGGINTVTLRTDGTDLFDDGKSTFFIISGVGGEATSYIYITVYGATINGKNYWVPLNWAQN